MIMVLAGTEEGRTIAAALERAGFDVLATAVSPYGSLLLQKNMQGMVLSGELDKEKMAAVLVEKAVKMVIDATHPFAVNVSSNARDVCTRLCIPLLRFERTSLQDVEGDRYKKITFVADEHEAILAVREAKKIFLTTGSSTLKTYVQKLGVDRIIVRVLPTVKSLTFCEEAGISPANIIAMQGPFSIALNREMFQSTGADVIVTKESGKTGGLEEKIRAAEQLELPVIVIRRPPLLYGTIFSSLEERLPYVERELARRKHTEGKSPLARTCPKGYNKLA